MKKTIAAALLVSTLIPGAAFAQAASGTTETPAAAQSGAMGTQSGAMGSQDQGTMNDMGSQAVDAPATSTASAFVTIDQAAAWRVSELEGTDVYGSGGDRIGEINDVLVDRQGEVKAVLVGVGGFLGIGEKDVAVSMSSLQFQSGAEIDNTSTASTSAVGTTATGTTAGDQASATDDDAADLERVVLNVTREQLEQAPAYANAGTATGMSGGATAPAATDTATPGATTTQ